MFRVKNYLNKDTISRIYSIGILQYENLDIGFILLANNSGTTVSLKIDFNEGTIKQFDSLAKSKGRVSHYLVAVSCVAGGKFNTLSGTRDGILVWLDGRNDPYELIPAERRKAAFEGKNLQKQY